MFPRPVLHHWEFSVPLYYQLIALIVEIVTDTYLYECFKLYNISHFVLGSGQWLSGRAHDLHVWCSGFDPPQDNWNKQTNKCTKYKVKRKVNRLECIFCMQVVWVWYPALLCLSSLGASTGLGVAYENSWGSFAEDSNKTKPGQWPKKLIFLPNIILLNLSKRNVFLEDTSCSIQGLLLVLLSGITPGRL